MIQNIPLEKVLFLDIETVPNSGSWEELPETEQNLWDKKTRFQRKDEISAEDYYEKAGIMAEFGKIICITIGMLEKNETLRIKSFADDDEKKMLTEFGELFNSPRLRDVILCAHNGKEFDFPWIARRFLINGMMPPTPFQLFGKKPWEIQHLDTMELWKFGDYKSYISLELLAHVFGIPTPKDDIDGSMVSSIYYIEKDLQRIVDYCEKDVLTLANIFRRMRQEDLLNRNINSD
ncbi:3'-5' exonuclease [Chryseobacterium sp. Ch-15]|uniref:3'-5' exonuclease n=1 Tax=Chryseobacterium muglaense TaxID=2893752 RepID=A0A9Q3YVX7_9FLAO|nr:3'-5' exonuclease [Chryseobacterium muglaense]MBD3904978.1 3'-5' exonuclease [Chryseobacterium muglaense]MCC9035155.1 3'-5' exonuclease [Chryseobacterium muglaense]MCM2554654.1 3'-5' exonuclease [Chryseobacterium muglaense]